MVLTGEAPLGILYGKKGDDSGGPEQEEPNTGAGFWPGFSIYGRGRGVASAGRNAPCSRPGYSASARTVSAIL